MEESMLGTWKVWWSLVFLGSLCAASAFRQQCGTERWTVKTGTDSEASQVTLASPQPATIAELIALTPPNPIPKTTRAAPTEKTVFVVDATLTDYKFETGPTGDSRLPSRAHEPARPHHAHWNIHYPVHSVGST
jgi:hypothetical protein